MELENHPFLEGASPELLAKLIADSTTIRIPTGQRIFDEGDPSDCFYLILEGVIGFQKLVTGESRYRTISRARVGQSFGEIGVLNGKPRSLRAVVIEESVLARLSATALQTYFESVPGPLRNLVSSVIEHLEQTTRQYLEVLLHQEKMTTIGAMMNSIINSFQNPFTIIGMGTHLLSVNHPDPQSRKLCDTIETQVRVMNAQINELKDFAQGVQRLKREPVNLPALIERLREVNYHYFRHDNIAFDATLPNVYLLGQEEKLLNLLQQLVENAIAAIGENDGQITISGELISDHLITIRVADNGPGIPEAIRQNLFDPFVSYGENRGAGIGAALAKAIVEAHRGTIRFTSEPGQGTTFHMKFPCYPTEEEARRSAEGSRSPFVRPDQHKE